MLLPVCLGLSIGVCFGPGLGDPEEPAWIQENAVRAGYPSNLVTGVAYTSEKGTVFCTRWQRDSEHYVCITLANKRCSAAFG